MDINWVACNRCHLSKALNSSIDFWYLTCKHIFCNSCIGKLCPICHRRAFVIKIDKDMPPTSAKQIFTKLNVLLRRLKREQEIQLQQRQHFERVKHTKILHVISRLELIKRMGHAIKSLNQDATNRNRKLLKAKEYLTMAKKHLNKPFKGTQATTAIQTNDSDRFEGFSYQSHVGQNKQRRNANYSRKSNATFDTGFSSRRFQ